MDQDKDLAAASQVASQDTEVSTQTAENESSVPAEDQIEVEEGGDDEDDDDE